MSVNGSSPRRRRSGQHAVRGYVLERLEFNETRMRLPRAVRRGIAPAPEGHVGLIAQATDHEGGVPISALYDTAPAGLAHQRLRELERRLASSLG